MPKKFRMCVPTMKEAISKIKLFTATWRARARRAALGYSLVSARKTGLPPSGFTMGKSALSMSNRFLAVSSNHPPGRRV